MSNNNDDDVPYSVTKEKTRQHLAPLIHASPEDADATTLEFRLSGTANLEATIQGLVDMINQDEEQLVANKRTVNRLCLRAGRPAMYPDADLTTGVQLGNIRSDQYYGQPLATAIRSILESRRASNLGAATVREIYDTLIKGGFKFDAKDENAIRGLRQSLTKNSGTFHKLPNGGYGLLEWYPGAKPARPSDGDDDE